MTKRPTTYEEQMNILRERGIVISDETFCLDALTHLNYYRLSAYMLPYKNPDGTYKSITFETIYRIYEFDRKLRNLLLVILEEIELSLRTRLSYYHAHLFGPLGYMDAQNYNRRHKHEDFTNEFSQLVNRNKDALFVIHHRDNKNNEFPLWVAVELFPFGMLSRFFADMPDRRKKEFARKYFYTGHSQLESWLLCLSTLRNRCAHYGRLYNFNFNKWPATPNKVKGALKNTVFDYIRVLRYCYADLHKWQREFLIPLKALIDEYEQYIDRQYIGFPDDWESILG